MLDLHVHHIGYLVKKIETAITQFEKLGYQCTQETVYDPSRKIHICFMEKDGYLVELISPASPDSVVSGLMKKYKNSPYHLCYQTSHFEETLAELAQNGYTVIGDPLAAPACNNRRVVFLMNAGLGMIELLDQPPLFS